MNYKARVLKRYPGAKLVKEGGQSAGPDGRPVTYSVSDGQVTLSEGANSPTDAWRRAATFLDHPYSDPHTRWGQADRS